MVWMPPTASSCAKVLSTKDRNGSTIMKHAAIIGIDLAKQKFQLHGATADGAVLFRKQLTRGQLVTFLQATPRCVVAMEACATAHFWGREVSSLGHDVRLIAPIYVKPFVKRQKNDANDAHAIAEAAARPTMRFVPVKAEERQATATLFRARKLLVGQRTQLLNALRGHLAEHGAIAPAGAPKVQRLASKVIEAGDQIPGSITELARLMLGQIEALGTAILELENKLKISAKKDDAIRKLQTMPGIGPMTAVALQAFVPDPKDFKSGRDFAAWVGLVPRQHSTGGKTRLGRTSKMGQQDIRRLLIIGAMALVRWAQRRPPKPGSWLAKMLARKPKMLVAIALANKMARGVWAMMTRNEAYRDPMAA